MDFDIEKIIDMYSDVVYRIAIARTRSRADAEDIFQEVFFTCSKKKPQFNDEEHCKAWLIRTTILCCKKFLSLSWLRKTVPLEDTVSVEMEESESSVYCAVMELPYKYRIVIWMFYFEDMSVYEIHKALNIKEATIRSQLTRGRKMLREKLKGEYFHDEA